MSSSNETAIRRYSSPREGSGYWAAHAGFVESAKSGQLLQIMPATVELALALACNQACPECPFREARAKRRLRRLPLGAFAESDDVAAMSVETAKTVILKARKAGATGLLGTGGGEPTLNRDLIEIFRYSAELGMENALYTNGIQLGLHPEMATGILDVDCRPVFVRVSLNVSHEDTGRRFSGIGPEAIAAQFEGLKNLFSARDRLWPKYNTAGMRPPSIQISTIVSECNVGDLPALYDRVAGIAACRTVTDREDAVVIRPLTHHCADGYSTTDHGEAVVRAILDCVGRDGGGRRVLEGARLSVRLGFGLDQVERGAAPSYRDLLDAEYQGRDVCRANGLFLTVGPDARAHLCTDRNCYDEWAIGDLKTQTVTEIYGGSRRAALLDAVHKHRCGPAVCEATCRLIRLNRIARAIQSGELTDADAEAVRAQHAGSRPLLLS